jgi:uncharacterized membrane protein YgdD (TMEM256/DUF423 family)
MIPTRPFFIATAGLSGALGVALSAVAAHRPDLPNLGTAANMLLFHAPAFLALSMMIESRMRLAGGFVLAAGLALFAGDLLTRAFFGTRLFPMAAPTGGTLLIAGWLVIGASAFISGETSNN